MTVTEQLTRESFVDSGAIAKMHADDIVRAGFDVSCPRPV
jgi:hypothetical protein